MHQIDVLISAKQQEWVEKWEELNSQLQQRDRELATVRQALWVKDTEVLRYMYMYTMCSCPTGIGTVPYGI